MPPRSTWAVIAYAVTCLALCGGCAESIHDLAAAGDIDAVTALVARDASRVDALDPLGKTPLFFAITYGKVEVAELLLGRGADVNARDRTGLTPLHVAAWWTRTDRAALLLGHGANLEAQDDFGDTPLHIAAAHGRLAMTQFLLTRGADPYVKNYEGLTPLELARRHRQTKAVALLGGPERDSQPDPEMPSG